MNLDALTRALAPSEVAGARSVEISDLAYDTRAAGPGALFFCVPGERYDGHAFARDAVDRGAAALVVERVLELDVSQLVVPDARRAMSQAALAAHGGSPANVTSATSAASSTSGGTR